MYDANDPDGLSGFEQLQRDFPIFRIKNRTGVTRSIPLSGGESTEIAAFTVDDFDALDFMQIPDFDYFTMVSPSIGDLLNYEVLERTDPVTPPTPDPDPDPVDEDPVEEDEPVDLPDPDETETPIEGEPDPDPEEVPPYQEQLEDYVEEAPPEVFDPNLPTQFTEDYVVSTTPDTTTPEDEPDADEDDGEEDENN